MPRLKTYLSGRWRWFVDGLSGDIRSAFVGAAVGSLSTMVVTALARSEPIYFSAVANAQGYAQPLRPLGNAVISSGEDVIFEYQPPELEKTYVCEFAQVEAETHRQLMLNYLSRYPTCFAVTQLSPSKYRVFTTASTMDIQRSNGNFLCKCPLP
ncbi:hypothetical protein [Rhizobium laguerreae]|uniref:hypothetical protein n=1 Tax=Rhizobium laguerreae TaxID=1076926 RepID=UPI00144231D2|nr:hypothetical protein [Rhizobium laguerreae]NKM69414.1 hypothetical protein [Rhizobium laguerreae]